MKKIFTVTTAFLLATATIAGLSGCAGDRYNQSTGEHIDDAATTGRVKDALSGDTLYKYPDVKVTTFKGVVQLSGFVDNREQKAQAGKVAKNAPGVKDVENNITIKQ